MFPLTNSIIPEINWQTPPKKINTPIKTFGVATPRTFTPKMEMRKIPDQFLANSRAESRKVHTSRKGQQSQRSRVREASVDYRKRRLSPVVDVAAGGLQSLQLGCTCTIRCLHLVSMVVGIMAFRRHFENCLG